MHAPDGTVHVLAKVVTYLADGDKERAAGALEPLRGITRVTHPIELAPALPRGQRPVGNGQKTRNPSPTAIARVFVRDGFTCVYCGRQTVPTQVLRLVSAAFPEAFPFQKNWQRAIAPRAYWDISTSLDHIHAVSTGGDWQAVENLATACYRCQEQKNHASVEALGWHVQRATTEWDGLTGLYPTVYEKLGQPQPNVHGPWLRAFAAARL
jgi:5-methylcytosine-specific restriction endonuclease McrA